MESLIAKFLSFLTMAFISSGLCGTIVYKVTSSVAKKASEKIMDDRIDAKLVPVNLDHRKELNDIKEKHKEDIELLWVKYDKFKDDIKERYLSKEVFELYNKLYSEP